MVSAASRALFLYSFYIRQVMQTSRQDTVTFCTSTSSTARFPSKHRLSHCAAPSGGTASVSRRPASRRRISAACPVKCGGAFVNQAHGLFIRLRDAGGERLPLAFQLRKTGAQRGEYRVRLPLRFERPQLCQPRSHRFSGQPLDRIRFGQPRGGAAVRGVAVRADQIAAAVRRPLDGQRIAAGRAFEAACQPGPFRLVARGDRTVAHAAPAAGQPNVLIHQALVRREQQARGLRMGLLALPAFPGK